MNEEERALLYATDKSVGLMAQSVEQLARSIKSSNNKIEDVLSVVTTQNVLMEKLNNMDTNLKESFGRIHGRVSTIEDAQNGDGCTSLKASADVTGVLKDRVDKVEITANGAMQSATVKWAVAIMFIYVSGFGTYLVKELHRLDNLTVDKIQKQRGLNSKQELINKNNTETFRELGEALHLVNENLNRNYGQILGMQNKGKGNEWSRK